MTNERLLRQEWHRLERMKEETHREIHQLKVSMASGKRNIVRVTQRAHGCRKTKRFCISNF